MFHIASVKPASFCITIDRVKYARCGVFFRDKKTIYNVNMAEWDELSLWANHLLPLYCDI